MEDESKAASTWDIALHDTLNTASGIESAGQAGMVNSCHTTFEFVSNTFACTPRGHIHIKGKGEVEMYFVEGVL